MYSVTRHIEGQMELRLERCIGRPLAVTYTVTCDSCKHRCTLTFRTRTVSLFADVEKCDGVLCLLCTRLVEEDSADLVGTMRRILDARNKED